MQRMPPWVACVFVVLLLGSAAARLRSPAVEAGAGGAAAFLVRSQSDPRRMSVRELRTLPGLGEGLARELAATHAARAAQGFRWEEVPGIGPVRARELGAWFVARGLPAEPFEPAGGRYAAAMPSSSSGAWLGLAALALTGCGGKPDAAASPERVEPRTPELSTLVLGESEVAVAASAPSGREAVVLLHGARCSLADWIDLGTFARLERRGVRVLAFDWPGSGASPMPAREPDAAELLAALLCEASIERALLVGPSRGGAQALALAARGEPRLAGLLLIAPAGARDFEPGPGFSVPTWLLWGADDDIVPLSAGQALAARLGGARLEVWPGHGHACYREDPQRFQGFLETVLAELGFPSR